MCTHAHYIDIFFHHRSSIPNGVMILSHDLFKGFPISLQSNSRQTDSSLHLNRVTFKTYLLLHFFFVFVFGTFFFALLISPLRVFVYLYINKYNIELLDVLS